MRLFKKIRRIIRKTFAIAEKNIHIEMRFKLQMVITSVAPIITIIMPIIILGRFFGLNTDFGPWNDTNFIVFVFIGYNIMLLRRMVPRITNQLQLEKYWKTFPALIIAPFNRFYLLFGYILSELFIVSLPFILFLILTFIFYPISFLTLLSVIVMFLCITIIFAGLSLIIGVFALSNESIMAMLNFLISLIFWASCVTYPFELFPSQIQIIINLNPIYYLIDLIRLAWIENNLLLTFFSHPYHIFIFTSSLLIFPILGVITFNKIYKKLGVSG